MKINKIIFHDFKPQPLKHHITLKPNFCKSASNNHQIDLTRSSWWPHDSELSSNARGQAGHGIELRVESPRPLFIASPVHHHDSNHSSEMKPNQTPQRTQLMESAAAPKEKIKIKKPIDTCRNRTRNPNFSEVFP